MVLLRGNGGGGGIKSAKAYKMAGETVWNGDVETAAGTLKRVQTGRGPGFHVI